MNKKLVAALVVAMLGTALPTANAGTLDRLLVTGDGVLSTLTRDGVVYKDELGYAWWNRLRTGEAPWSGELVFYVDAGINTQTYAFAAALVSASGRAIPLALTSDIVDAQLGKPCYRAQCQGYLVYGPVNLPLGSEIGEYELRVSANWLGTTCVGTVCQTDVPTSKLLTFPRAIVLLPADARTAPATAPATPKGSFLLGRVSFTSAGMSSWDAARFRVRGYTWQQLDAGGAVVSQATASATNESGTVYAWWEWQLAGAIPATVMRVRIAATNDYGIGPWSEIGQFLVPGQAPVVSPVVRKVVCLKGKTKKTVAGKRCPAGWKIIRRIY